MSLSRRLRSDAEQHTLSIRIPVVFLVRRSQTTPSPLLVALHGYGGTAAAMLHRVGQVAPSAYSIISVQGPHQHTRANRRSGAQTAVFGWGVTGDIEAARAAHTQIIDAVIRWAHRSGVCIDQEVVLTGFSESVGLNYLYAGTHRRVSGLVAICGDLPHSDCPRLPNVLLLAGAADPLFPAPLVASRANEIRHRCSSIEVVICEGGHEITDSMLKNASEWLAHMTAPRTARPPFRQTHSRRRQAP